MLLVKGGHYENLLVYINDKKLFSACQLSLSMCFRNE